MTSSAVPTTRPRPQHWQKTLLERCLHHRTLPDFPDLDLRERFSTKDKDGRDLPSQEIVEFVFSSFGAYEGTDDPVRQSFEMIQGATKLVELCLKGPEDRGTTDEETKGPKAETRTR